MRFGSGTLRYIAQHAFLIAAMLAVLNSCIEPYDSGIEEQVNLISVDGSLVKGDSLQTVIISRTTTLINPRWWPVRNCSVVIVDELGNEFIMDEKEDGIYQCHIEEEQLVDHRKYRLLIDNPFGDSYVSDFEELLPAVSVDSVYYELDSSVDPFTGLESKGAQFYLDLLANDSTSRFFRWKLKETWEYTMVEPITFYYDYNKRNELEVIVPDNEYELYRCWRTEAISNLYLTTTKNLAENSKKKIPLHFVSDQTDRLRLKYSVHVRQYPISEAAFKYWDLNRASLQESGGLYTTQPGKAITNIWNLTDSTTQVLGFFWVSSVSSKRLTIVRPPDIIPNNELCTLVPFEYTIHLANKITPRYIYIDEFGTQLTGPQVCFDCRLRGGVLTKPEYWDE
jgi:hypothetical protein